MKRRVLLVDDSLTVRMDLSEALEEAGFDVVPVASLADARRSLGDGGIDLVVLDVVLPDGDGVELLSELRGADGGEFLPVILLSSEAEVEDRIRGLRRGANEYVGKPYDAEYVVARAAQLLRTSAERAGRPLILIVDDSPTYRAELRETLEAADYEVVAAANAHEGLRKASQVRPTAIVVDGVLPDHSGQEVIASIRRDPGLSATPCLLLTASRGSTEEVSALDAGADAYVRKDEGLSLVLARLGAILRGASDSRVLSRVTSALAPKRVLTVDDSLTYLEEIRAALCEDGYEVVRASSGQAALELLEVESFDCILLDLIMPGMSGTELCRILKARPGVRDIPLVILSAVDEKASMIDGINVGADDYVVKTQSFDVIRARVRAQLRRRQFEEETRRIHQELLQKEADTKAARLVADARQELLVELEAKNAELEAKNAELARLNKELETFAYSVSHDLRQPLRGMDGFSRALLEQYAPQLDDKAQHYLRRIGAGATRMGELIDGILTLSRVSRATLVERPVRLSERARGIVERLRDGAPDRRVTVVIDEVDVVHGDPQLLESLLENLLGNAWKFTVRTAEPRIHFGQVAAEGVSEFYVSDNGAGFDAHYADKLFGPFQRLHSSEAFEGTGIGLATAQRIVHRHGGRIWAEGRVDGGATFSFTLPLRDGA